MKCLSLIFFTSGMLFFTEAYSQLTKVVRDKIRAEAGATINSKNPIKETDIELVHVQGGTFSMPYWEPEPVWKTSHPVTVSSFHMGIYEITEAQWRVLMGDDYRITGCDSCAMQQMSWNEASEYVQKLSKVTGKHYRLPTNAEWEYALRGGELSRGYTFSGSNFPGDVMWCNENSGYKVHPVGKKQPNELGIFDMQGNVDEWCNDWHRGYRNHNYVEAESRDPKGPPTGVHKTIKGGAFYSPIKYATDPFLCFELPDEGKIGRGFRVVRTWAK